MDSGNQVVVPPKKRARRGGKSVEKLKSQQALLINEVGTNWSFHRIQMAYKTAIDNPLPICYFRGNDLFLEIEKTKTKIRVASYLPNDGVEYQDILDNSEETVDIKIKHIDIKTSSPIAILKVENFYFFLIFKNSKDCDRMDFIFKNALH